jgi:hypothetical protein
MAKERLSLPNRTVAEGEFKDWTIRNGKTIPPVIQT